MTKSAGLCAKRVNKLDTFTYRNILKFFSVGIWKTLNFEKKKSIKYLDKSKIQVK